MTTTWAKDPDAVLDFTFDWSEWLADVADAIVSFTVFASGVTVDSSFLADDDSVTAWVSGGVAGTTATVTCRIVTGLRTDDRSITLNIRNR